MAGAVLAMAVLAACGGSDDVDGTDGPAIEGAGGQGGSKPPVATGEDGTAPGAASDPTGRWILDEVIAERPGTADAWDHDAVIAIDPGEPPALFSGGQVEPATDCPVWGDLTLAEEAPADDERLLPPDGAQVVAAWAGTERFWCLGNPDSEADVLVGLLDDGRLLKTFETDVVVSVALRAA